ncbi:MAG: LLM class flavin-dependent oxidoreductase [Actinomycetia bacterium]|nr:LLM class flavin-dependent oxidoreductase [Actinomycetes bacterium]
MADPSTIPLSALDLAIVADGRTSADALAETTALAQEADRLGYERFWVAEHHNMATVASTNPPVLVAHLAAVTERIKVGSGGVMLPNHAPLVVAEQFAMLEALHPGRIDLGIGRAPGTDPATAAALRRSADFDAEDFPRNLIDVMGLLGDARSEEGLHTRFRATPTAASSPSVVLLGSSGFSARLAGILGLPFSFAHHFDMGGTNQASDIYREAFQPSPVLAEPYLIISASVVVGDTDEEAERLSAPSRLRRFGIRTGQQVPLLPPEEARAHPSFAVAVGLPSNAHVGTGDHVVAGLGELVTETGAQELMLFPVAYALEDRVAALTEIANRSEGLAR